MPTESEAKVRTKSRFDEVFQNYVALAEAKKKTKKKTPKEEHVVLETFSSQLPPVKDHVHETLESSTYGQEEDSPRITKKKARELLWEREEGDNGGAKEHRHAKSEKKKKKKTDVIDKSEPSDHQIENLDLVQQVNASSISNQPFMHSGMPVDATSREQRSPTEFENEEQLLEAYRLHVSQEETNEIKEKIKKKLSAHLPSSDDQQHLLPNGTKKKKRRKKKDLVETEPETSVMSLVELQAAPAEMHVQPPPEMSPHADVQEDVPKVKGVKSKKSKTDIQKLDPREEGVDKSIPRYMYDPSLVLGVYVHRSDKLKIDLLVSRPLVKVHVIDQKTGEYVKKETSSDAVQSFHDQERNEYVLPKYTQPYDFKRMKTLVPEWDEQIIFMEKFTHFLHVREDSPNVIVFFEILDLVHEDSLNTNSDIEIKEKAFQKVAWAFLKIVGANEVLNVDKKLRLQLYYPPSRARVASSTHVYEWWLKHPRNRYPSTLYVTVKGLKLPDHVNPNYSLAGQQDSEILKADLQNDIAMKDNNLTDAKKEPFKWTRLPGQACHIPNRHFLSLRGGQMGCFSLRFSHVGRTLAAACADRDGYPVYLYEIPSGQYLKELHGHLNVVYDLCWSKDDQNLLSASSDGTVRLWRIKNEASSALKVLPHPSFVYTAKFHPMSDDLAVTGCYDAVIRVWNVKVKETNGQLLQEFDGHKSFINSLCFDADGLHMFSGDSSGLIIMWNTSIIRSSKQNPVELWGILKEIKESEMKGIAVNHLQVHPNGRRLLIHTKDSTVRIMDLRILAAKKYIGVTNYREKLHSTVTPCGTFVVAGSEDGVAYVWNAETGDQVAKYTELSYTAPLRDVAFHPHEHMVAFCAFGLSQPIIVYMYDYKVAQLEAESVQTASDANGQNSSDILTFQDSVIAAKSSMRMMKVKQKLDSVLSMMQTSLGISLLVPFGMRCWLLQSGSSSFLPAPSLLSPHSKLKFTGTSSSQLQPLGTNTFGGFSPVGQSLHRTPSIKLQMSNSEAKVSSIKIETDSILPIQETVVALYDYSAHRSDELSIHRSDIIHVLYKDNDNWWFGSLQNGQQGYFPANYVAAEIQHEYDQPTASKSHSVSQEHLEAGHPEPTASMMSAVPSKSKDQKFMSHHDTDVGSPVTLGKRQKMQQMRQSPDFTSQPVDLLTAFSPSVVSGFSDRDLSRQDSSVKPKKKKSPKQITSVGKTNIAFQSDEQDAE
ncbi:jouberin isoform X2 [Dendropsophus ebraccatus]|uniref:jouberin isoform X2 n=1 Tax=Dendropsophus ebraccatus TaxID=150705 RepID=UPI0038314B1C